MKLEYTKVIDLINWCVANHIDYDHARDLQAAWYTTVSLDKCDWELEIPEEDLTYWMLKWD